MFEVTGSRSKVEPRSDHGVSQLEHGKNMCAKFQLLPAYGHRDLAMNGCGVKIVDVD